MEETCTYYSVAVQSRGGDIDYNEIVDGATGLWAKGQDQDTVLTIGNNKYNPL